MGDGEGEGSWVLEGMVIARLLKGKLSEEQSTRSLITNLGAGDEETS